MPRVPVGLSAGVVVYFLAMTGLSLVGLKLSSVVTAKAITLGLPYLLDKDPRRPSRIEQRHIDLAQAVPPMPVAKMVALKKPTAPDVLAAQLDMAETAVVIAEADTPALRGSGRAKYRFMFIAEPSAADAFNRSFGVLPVASN